MTTVNVYLTFQGNCEEAFNFYKSIFGGDFSYLGRFADIPVNVDMPPMSEDIKNQIMHISLPISKETILMGSDNGGDWGPPITIGNNFSIAINTDTKDEADRIFYALAEGGEITMPINDAFWGDYFGSIRDKFNINWMVMAPSKQ